MPDIHAVLLFDIAPRVAETFRNDPTVADLRDPAVLVEVVGDEGMASVVERTELEEILSAGTLDEGTAIEDVSHGDGLISVLVVDGEGASYYRVPDPRVHANRWPWMGDPEY